MPRGSKQVEEVLYRDVDDVAETLRNAKRHKNGCALFLGAGCSAGAKIPTARQFVNHIKRSHKGAYDRAQEKTYPYCMAQLLAAERRDLIASYVDRAKINWAHVCIAQLMSEGYVDRVLTTNFDPLVIRACSLLGDLPAVYDLAALNDFKPADLPERAVFYLHGQRYGFVLINTPAQAKKHAKKVMPVFDEAGRRRVWIVVGYSGQNDPLFDRLSSVKGFDHGLYWVGYGNQEPPEHVAKNLLLKEKGAFYVKGYDADSFFILLLQKLGCFPPDIVGKPFEHLDRILKSLAPYTPPRGTDSWDATRIAREQVKKAISNLNGSATLEREADRLLLAGDYERVIKLRPQLAANQSPELARALGWAYVMRGVALRERGQGESDEEERDRLFEQAYGHYAEALEIDPKLAAALNNWGSALFYQADVKPDDRERLLGLAREKYRLAAEIEPGISAYNLACLAAVEGNAPECRARLDEARKAGRLPRRKHIEADSDFESVRDLRWFRELLESA